MHLLRGDLDVVKGGKQGRAPWQAAWQMVDINGQEQGSYATYLHHDPGRPPSDQGISKISNFSGGSHLIRKKSIGITP
jgi:hypothetical protein